MKRRWLAGLVLTLWTGLASAAVIDVKVYDAFGAGYSTTEIGEQLGSLYNLEVETTMVLIVGPSLDDERLLEQEAIVAAIAPAEYGILYAVGTPTQTYTRGFSITPNAAAGLLPSNDAFLVLVLGPAGRVLYRSDSVVSRDKLLQIAASG